MNPFFFIIQIRRAFIDFSLYWGRFLKSLYQFFEFNLCC
jgi:hypothetical protein